jgi:hypothetical protein
MKRSKFSEEPIVYAPRQAESGTPVGDLCRQLGVSDATSRVGDSFESQVPPFGRLVLVGIGDRAAQRVGDLADPAASYWKVSGVA